MGFLSRITLNIFLTSHSSVTNGFGEIDSFGNAAHTTGGEVGSPSPPKGISGKRYVPKKTVNHVRIEGNFYSRWRLKSL